MAYTRTNYRTKKELKSAVARGDRVRCFEPGSVGPSLADFTGKVSLEGPHYPRPHTWYAEAELVDGIVKKVR